MNIKNQKKVFGYARVSTQNPKLDRQINKLTEEGVYKSNIYKEKITLIYLSSFKRKRTSYIACMV